MKRASNWLTPAALGFFALAAQTLLFRDFFAAFDANEIAIGAFFSAWLAWICAGAFAGRFDTRLHGAIARRLPAAALLYIPAFALQQVLLANARAMAGVEAYDVFPLLPMLAMAFIVNAPVSLATGFLFTLACRWAENRAEIPVARVYVLETLGGCAGGLFATAALAAGMPAENVALSAAALLTAAALSPLWCGRLASKLWCGRLACTFRAMAAVLVAVLIVVAVHGGAGRWLADARARAEWARLLPALEFDGAFDTPRARYLYGSRDGQFNVVSGGGVCDSLPPGEQAAEIAAVHLAQRPETRSALVIGGGGLGICLELLELPLIERVAWHHPDPDYAPRLIGLLPADLKERAARVQFVPQDPTLAFDPSGKYDLIILNIPDIATLALNHYVTERYYAELKKIVSETGAVSVRVSGGDNYLGGELLLQGSSLMFTLGRVFKEVTIKPGGETWVMASDAPFLYYPDGLRKQFASIPGAAGMYPPENIAVLYGAGRVGFQMQAYRKQIDLAGEDALLNTDDNPKAPAYALLVAIKQAGLPSAAGLVAESGSRGLRAAVAAILAAAIGIYGILRAVYLVKNRPGGRAGTFDSQMLVFTTGMAGMALGVALMFGYQSRFGSLFLDMGLVSALFMLGAFAGASAAARLWCGRLACTSALAVHAAALALLPYLAGCQSKPVWAAAFMAGGMLTGLYFPYAAHRLKTAGRETGHAGSNLELLDNLGGAAGAAVTGLLLLPLLGVTTTAALLAALVAVNMPGIVFGARQTQATPADRFDRFARPAGYALAGVGAFALIASHALAAALEPPDADALRNAALDLAGQRPIQDGQETRPGDAAVSYFTVPADGGQKAGWVFSTKPWAGSVYAFAGTFELAVLADESGALQAYEVVSSSETPMYLSMVRDADNRLVGRNLFTPDPFDGIDGVVGATSTDEAFRDAIAMAGQGFARDVLKTTGATAPASAKTAAKPRARLEFIVLAAFLAAATALSYRPRAWARRALLLASVLTLGLWFNLQYSTQQVMALLTGQPGRAGLNGPFFLLAAVPLAALVFGNLYCGYVCPFGALQELATDLGARLGIRRNPGRAAWKYARAGKYLVLFMLVVLYAFRRDLNVLRADPLLGFFSGQSGGLALAVALAAVGLSLVFGRFWCRNLCPAGAFLALVNGLRINGLRAIRRIAPARLPANCDLGAAAVKDLDCLCCDRCRCGLHKTAKPMPGWAFAIAAAAMMLAVAAITFHEPAHKAAATAVQTAAGQPRDVDIDKVKDLIQQRKLSGHPADFASPVTQPR